MPGKRNSQNSFGPLTFGLDIGIASVGWAVLGENRIIDLGVRCFDKAETADKGESLNLARRTARLMRRRLRRRAWRLTKLARLLKYEGLIADVNLLKQQPAKGFQTPNLWQLRVEALDRRLDAEEWARVIYHLVKHRGFHWINSAEKAAAAADKQENGKVKKALDDTRRRMAEYRYQTAAAMVLAEFPDAQRNKRGDYGKSLARELLHEELALLFQRQRELGNPHANAKLETTLLGNGDKKSGLFWAQKPALSGDALLKMLGKCTFEKAEYRAPKASFTAERHVWLTRLNNLRINVNGEIRLLNKAERKVALPLPYTYDTDLTYKRLHDALVKEGLLPASFTFVGLRATKKENDPLAQTLMKVPAWQELRKTLKKAGLESEWKNMSDKALNGHPEILDDIAWVLSVYKTDEETEIELRKLALPNPERVIKTLLGFPRTSFKTFHALSLKVLRQIVPHMEAGLRYDEACQKAGYHHSQPNKANDDDKEQYLPPLYEQERSKEPGQEGKLVFSERINREITGGIPRNPVVLRALNQARKVVNALIRKYKQQPHAVHIEMARDLSRPLTGHFANNGKYIEGRRDIEAKQKEYRDNNERDRARFIETFGREPKNNEFEKWRLYREQNGQCAYSQQPLAPSGNVAEIFTIGATEIDHALPYSRSLDDSKNNKVLVLTKENRDKGNRTPYEYLTSFPGGEKSERWRKFAAFVEATYPGKTRNAKRSRLLRKNFDEKEAKEFRESNLNDTRYICKFFKNYVERYLKLHDESDAKRCVVLSGQMTSFLRARWGLVKARGDSDRHHALDAAVVAAASHGMVKRLSDYSRRKELDKAAKDFVDTETGEIINHFPKPWQHFRKELLSRLCCEIAVNPTTNEQTAIFHNGVARLRNEIEHLGTYPPEALEKLRPLFVSRAPQRCNSGAAHKETIYAQPKEFKSTGQVLQHIELVELKRKHFGFLDDYFIQVKQLNATGYLTRKAAAKLFKTFADPKSDVWNSDRKWRECELADPQRNKEFYATLYDQLAKNEWDGKKAFDNGFNKLVRRKNAATMPPVYKVAVIDKLSGIPIRGGIAKNDTMLRVDVFKSKKDGKFHLVPVYVHHSVKGLPNRAIVAFKDEEEWTVMDDGHDFIYSLHPNDFVRITQRNGESICGYYRGCHSGTAALTVALHDRYIYGDKTTSLALHKKDSSKPIPNDKRGLIEGIGVKLAANIEKFNVDVLGNLFPAAPEIRRDLA